MKIESMLINEKKSVLTAMRQMDETAKKILYVVDDNEVFLGTLSDGDIRRWIIGGQSLNEPINKVANYHAHFLYTNEINNAKAYIQKNAIEALPIINERKKVVDSVFWNDFYSKGDRQSTDLPVVMMAGGEGKRLYPYTKILPKPLIPINEIPISERIMDHFYEDGCNDFYVVVNYKKQMIKAYYHEINKPYQITFADEDTPLGTAGGLTLIKDKIKTPFLLTNCDILVREDVNSILSFHKKQENKITMVVSMKNIQIPYGVIKFNNAGQIVEMKEKPELQSWVNTGCYIVNPEVLENIKEGVKIDFPDVIKNVIADGGKVGVYPINENQWLDMGQFDEMARMNSELDKYNIDFSVERKMRE